ncbi:MAG: PDZ domain-containing protein [Pirellulaceae bacterium]
MPIPRFLLRELDLLSNVGAEVVVVEEDGPASVSGVLAGDLIVAVNDHIVTSVDDVHRLTSDSGEESLLTLTVVRDGHKRNIDVRIAL